MGKTHIALGLLLASLALLVIYGADVLVASSKSSGGATGNTGFLPLNEAIRGGAFGGGAVVMSIAGFIVARKQPSSSVAILLLINGGIIIAGMIGLIAQGALSGPSRPGAASTVGSTIVLGGILIALGVWKSVGDRRVLTRNQQA